MAQNTEAQQTGPSMMVQLALLVGLTVMAAGLGWLTGSSLIAPPAENTEPGTIAPKDRSQATAHDETEADSEGGAAATPNLYALEPITTNLSDPREVWVRLELSLVFDGAAEADVAERIHQDILAYLRTVKLEQIDSASGFRHLKADLGERAAIRSDGRVKDILIRTLLFE